jgi:hypothetical protein
MVPSRAGIAQAPAPALVDAGDARPGQLAIKHPLDDLDQAADLGRPTRMGIL